MHIWHEYVDLVFQMSFNVVINMMLIKDTYIKKAKLLLTTSSAELSTPWFKQTDNDLTWQLLLPYMGQL